MWYYSVNMIIDLIVISVIFIDLILGIFVVIHNLSSSKNRLFGLVCFLAAVWTFTNLMTDKLVSTYWLERSYSMGALLISAGLIWVYVMTQSKPQKLKIFLISFFGIIVSAWSLVPGFISQSYTRVTQIYAGTVFSSQPGWGLYIFSIFYFSVSITMIILLVKAKKHTAGTEKAKQYTFILSGVMISLTTTAISSFILPSFSIYLTAGIDSIGFLIFLLLVGYSITRHHLFNIRVFAIELLTFTLWTFIFARIFLVDNIEEAIIEIGLLVISMVLGSILIRAVRREIIQKEKLEKLTDEITKANTSLTNLNATLNQKVLEQTAEVRHAYDLEKKARRDLEKLNETKDQFILISQHHLRTPVTGIKWELEMILSGQYGKLGAPLKQAITEANTSVGRLTRIVDDFLSITALKIGSNILDIKPANLKPLLDDVVSELRIDIANKHIAVNYSRDEKDWPDLNIDAGKMREVILIVIENAVKYNHDAGSIDIQTHSADEKFEMAIVNTGAGMVKEDHAQLFNHLFYRGEQARKLNPVGMGVGLSVARAIVRAHHGELTIESEGEGKGARVMIMLPI